MTETNTINSEDIKQIELAFERVLHRNGLVNGHPLTVSERQGIAIRTAVSQMRRAITLLLGLASNSSSREFKLQCEHHAQQLAETAEAMEKEFKL